MNENEVGHLIAELKALKIRASTIVAQLEAHKQEGPRNEGNKTSTGNEQEFTVNGLKKGDRVRIKNKVKKPATWPDERPWIKEAARLATITRVTKDQIHFRTDNGTATWRAPNNLERILD